MYLKNSPRPYVLGAFEEEVLEEVGHARALRVSFLEPTWYITETATMGALWSSCRMT